MPPSVSCTSLIVESSLFPSRPRKRLPEVSFNPVVAFLSKLTFCIGKHEDFGQSLRDLFESREPGDIHAVSYVLHVCPRCRIPSAYLLYHLAIGDYLGSLDRGDSSEVLCLRSTDAVRQ